jgi:hypothetical protein
VQESHARALKIGQVAKWLRRHFQVNLIDLSGLEIGEGSNPFLLKFFLVF